MNAVVSSIYGDYDRLVAPVEQREPCEFILVSDREYDVPGWKVVVEPRPHMHPRFAAKVAKCLPGLYTKAERVVWMDGSMRVMSPDCVSWLIEAAGTHVLAQFGHPSWKTLHMEAQVAGGMDKYKGQPLRAQADYYRGQGYPDDFGHWETGVIVYNRAHTWLDEFGWRWLAEQARWTYEDQLSEGPLLWALGRKPFTLPHKMRSNGYFEVRGHPNDLK